jgi:hypothetical protein
MKNPLATAYWADDAAKMARMARELGRESEAIRLWGFVWDYVGAGRIGSPKVTQISDPRRLPVGDTADKLSAVRGRGFSFAPDGAFGIWGRRNP